VGNWSEVFAETVAQVHEQHPGLRNGQAHYLALNRLAPSWAAQVAGRVGVDPFHDDECLPAFYDWLGRRTQQWNDDE
jgi:hypothetical protein